MEEKPKYHILKICPICLSPGIELMSYSHDTKRHTDKDGLTIIKTDDKKIQKYVCSDCRLIIKIETETY